MGDTVKGIFKINMHKNVPILNEILLWFCLLVTWLFDSWETKERNVVRSVSECCCATLLSKVSPLQALVWPRGWVDL